MAAADPGPPGPTGPPAPVQVVELDWRSVAVLLAGFVGLVAVTGLIRSAPRTLAAVAVGTLLALALNPLVGLLERRMRLPRRAAVPAVLVGFAVALAAAALLLVPPAVRQANDLGRELPAVLADLRDLPVVGDDLAAAKVPERMQESIEELPSRLAGDAAPLQRVALSLADSLLAAGATLLLAVTLLLDGGRLLGGARRLVPRRHRPRAERLADLAYRVVGRYVAGSVTVAGIAGCAVLVAGLVLRVPLTPLLAVWVALWNLVPQIGGAAGGIPFVLLGVTRGPLTGLACAAFFLIYMQIENNVLGPLLVGQAVKLSPPATMTAALIGVSAGGVVGALLAVPIVGAAKVVYSELRPSPRQASLPRGVTPSPSHSRAP